jgi:hypothetical protein
MILTRGRPIASSSAWRYFTNASVIGVGIAKSVFQAYLADLTTGEINSIRHTRGKFLNHFANRQTALIDVETCGSAHANEKA